jgi:hypothetical protein
MNGLVSSPGLTSAKPAPQKEVWGGVPFLVAAASKLSAGHNSSLIQNMPVEQFKETVLEHTAPTYYFMTLRAYVRVNYQWLSIKDVVHLTKEYQTDKMTPGYQDSILTFYGKLVMKRLTAEGAIMLAEKIDEHSTRGTFLGEFFEEHLAGLAPADAEKILVQMKDRGSTIYLLTRYIRPHYKKDLNPAQARALFEKVASASEVQSLMREYYEISGTQPPAPPRVAPSQRRPVTVDPWGRPIYR